MPYQLRDEDNELMRVVARKEEALDLLKLRPQWSIVRVTESKQDRPHFEDAPF